MIRNIIFSNYRLFSSQQSMRLAPITVVFGKNNIGKSAILKLPLLIQSALHEQSPNVFSKTTINEIILCDEFRDVVYGKANKKVQLSISSDDSSLLQFGFIVDKDLTGEWYTIIESWKLISDDFTLNIKWDYDQSKYFEEGSTREIQFQGIKPLNCTEQDRVSDILLHFHQLTDYIGPIRTVDMKREFRLSPIGDKPYSGKDGILNYTYLVKSHLSVERPLFDKVTKWYQKNFDGWKLGVDKSRDPLYSLTMTLGNMKNDLQDMGEGIVQSLPIVTAVCRDYGFPTLLELEEPGTHLHPAAQGPLAELIVSEILDNPSKKFLIETHSLNFILRLRSLVASGKLPLENVELYYVEFDKENSTSCLKSAGLKADGSVTSWPENVFKEAFQEVLNIRKAQIKHNSL